MLHVHDTQFWAKINTINSFYFYINRGKKIAISLPGATVGWIMGISICIARQISVSFLPAEDVRSLREFDVLESNVYLHANVQEDALYM